jgi:hypothetical protein
VEEAVSCPCNCHRKSTGGNPAGCEYCRDRHAAPAGTPDPLATNGGPAGETVAAESLQDLARRLRDEAKLALGPTAPVVIMAGDLAGGFYVAWQGTPLALRGLLERGGELLRDAARAAEPRPPEPA